MQTHREGRGHVTTEAMTGVMHLQVKEHQGLLGPQNLGERLIMNSPLEPSERLWP